MKKITYVLLVVLLLILTACGGGGSKLSDEDKATYIEKAKEVIGIVNAGEFEKLEDISMKELTDALTDDVKAQIISDIKEKGEFVEFGKGDAVVQEDKNSKDPMTIVQQVAKYENKELLYTIIFNKDAQLAGLYYK